MTTTHEQDRAEYEILAGKLTETIGAAAAAPMLSALVGLYHDPAQRLAVLRETIDQQAKIAAVEQSTEAEANRRSLEAERARAAAGAELAAYYAKVDAEKAKSAPPVQQPPSAPVEPERSVPTTVKQRARNATGPLATTGTYSLKGDFFKMPNDVAEELLAVMPGPVLKAYVYAHRLANITGTFWISYGTVAQKIGCKSARHGRRVFVRLQKAGLVRLLDRGGAKAHKANVYQLVPFDVLDMDAVRATLAEPLTMKKAKEK